MRLPRPSVVHLLSPPLTSPYSPHPPSSTLFSLHTSISSPLRLHHDIHLLLPQHPRLQKPHPIPRTQIPRLPHLGQLPSGKQYRTRRCSSTLKRLICSTDRQADQLRSTGWETVLCRCRQQIICRGNGAVAYSSEF